MNKYKYVIQITAEVEAFDEDDAWDAIQDTFGIGESGSGITVIESEWTYKK